MKAVWSNHAKEQRAHILRIIAKELSREDASRWNGKFRDAVKTLAEFPETGDSLSPDCFAFVPPHVDRLKQTLCSPYRIVYECLENEIHVLAILHSRMFIWPNDVQRG